MVAGTGGRVVASRRHLTLGGIAVILGALALGYAIGRVHQRLGGSGAWAEERRRYEIERSIIQAQLAGSTDAPIGLGGASDPQPGGQPVLVGAVSPVHAEGTRAMGIECLVQRFEGGTPDSCGIDAISPMGLPPGALP